MKRALSVSVVLGMASVAALAFAQTPPVGTGGPVTEVSVSGGQRALLKIAIAPMAGDKASAQQAKDTATKDFTLSGLFQVLDEKSFVANLAKEGDKIEPSSWRSVGADGVLKGTMSKGANGIKLELQLFVVSRGAEAVLKKTYDVPANGVRGAMHQFGNEVVKYFTGTSGTFGSRLVFSASVARGEKGVFVVESDGDGLARLQTVSNVSLAPAIGPGGIYYAAGLADGTYSLFRVGTTDPILRNSGLIFGASFGNGKMALVVSQSGASDIFVGSPDGSNMKKITPGGLNTHPSFGPGGQVAYVSNQSGSPQIYVDGKRVSWKGTYNMAPVFCNEADGTRILYMGRDGSSWDIFSVALSGDAASTRRLTQDQGSNTYPACSPDGRLVAFFSTRGGLYTATSKGENQQKIADAQGESLRWEGN